MDAGAVAAALEEALFYARQDSRPAGSSAGSAGSGTDGYAGRGGGTFGAGGYGADPSAGSHAPWPFVIRTP